MFHLQKITEIQIYPPKETAPIMYALLIVAPVLHIIAFQAIPHRGNLKGCKKDDGAQEKLDYKLVEFKL